MKKLLLFVFILCSQIGFAQPYKSIFGQTSTQWVFEWSNLSGTFLDTFYIEKDTVVQGMAYKKLSIKKTSPISVALLREDTTIGKVWYKGLRTEPFFSDADTTERLSFDFSLQAGDSVDISSGVCTGPPGAYPPSWNMVDSVRHIAGSKHVYFRGACNWYDPPPYEPITFIEGIGCNVSPMFKHNGTTPLLSQYILCSYKDGNPTFYNNQRYNGACTLPTAVDDKSVTRDAIIISPNPADDVLHLEYPSGEKLVNLVLYNVSGQRAAEHKDGADKLSVKGLTPGVYFLQIKLAGRPPQYRHIVVR